MTKLAVQVTLSEALSRYNTTEKMYLLAILKGYSLQESFNLAQSLGTGIETYILKPDISEARDKFYKEGWWKREDVDKAWKELLFNHFTELVMLEAIKEMGKTNRDNVIIKEAGKFVNAQRNINLTLPTGETYDERMLREHG